MKTKPLKPTASEREVTRQVLEAAAWLGIDLKRRNVGGMTNTSGRYVAFGQPGDSDRYATLPFGLNAGKTLEVEIKHEGFDPAKLRGEKRAHFERQLARLQKTNEQGGIAFWCDDATEFMAIMVHVLGGARVHEPGYGRPTVFYSDVNPDPDDDADGGPTDA